MAGGVVLPLNDGVAAEPGEARTSLYAWYVVGFLTLASTVSVIDRQILALMIGPVKRDLGVSDTMMGLLGGLAFTLFYTFLTLPMAWLADRGSRRKIIGWGIFFWSLATVACGLAGRYWQLFVTRMCVGIGEAALSPAAVSMLSDYFHRSRLPLALGIFSAAPLIGVGLANMLGGAVVQYLESVPELVVPVAGTLRSWQVMFIAVGLPGILLALLALTVREPLRRGRAALADGAQDISFAEIMRFIGDRRSFLTWHFIAYTALSMQGWGLFYWVVEFFIREHGAQRGTIGLTYGAIALTFGAAGSIIAGMLSGKLMAAGKPDATLRIVMYTSLILIPIGIVFPLVPGYATALLLVTVATFFMGWPSGLGMAALQFVVPNELRGRIIALYLVVVNFLSYSFGPLLGGILSDNVGGDRPLGTTLALMAAINYPIGAFAIWRALRHFRTALDAARAWEPDPSATTVKE